MENDASRPCDVQKDNHRLVAFWEDCRIASDVRRYPTIWRLRLLLTSRVNDPEKETRIWEDAAGNIIGFAMLWRRQVTSPYIVLEGFAHPSAVTEHLLFKILRWGYQQACDLAAEQEIELTVYATGFSQYSFGESLLRAFGFSPVPADSDEYNVYYTLSLLSDIPIPSLPPGYIIRGLSGISDLDAYQSLYGFARVTPHHQKILLESDEYSHLVVENSVGEFIAYCECSIWRAEWDRTVQRIGWIDYIETKPGQQKRGFGLAVLLAGLSQLKN